MGELHPSETPEAPWDTISVDRWRRGSMSKWRPPRAMNETLNKFLVVMANQEVARNVAPPPLASLPPVATPLKASQPSRVNPGAPGCKGNLTDLRRILHLSLAKGNPK
jgi:hypothetical protein